MTRTHASDKIDAYAESGREPWQEGMSFNFVNMHLQLSPGVDTGFGRDWDYQIVWNRPKYTKTSQNYYYDQPITYHGGETKVLKRYSTDQYTDWAVDFVRGDRDLQIEMAKRMKKNYGMKSMRMNYMISSKTVKNCLITTNKSQSKLILRWLSKSSKK